MARRHIHHSGRPRHCPGPAGSTRFPRVRRDRDLNPYLLVISYSLLR
jgi:hypothetical protein